MIRSGMFKSRRFLPGALLFLAVVASCALVHHPNAGWNVNTRLNLVFAVVDMQTLSIDAYHDLEPYATNDKAFFDGRFYSDKVFGVSLLALPVYAGMRGAFALFGAFPEYQTAHYWMRLLAVSVPAGVGLVLLWRLLMLAGAAPRRALLACSLVFWGSMQFGYATLFMPYAPGICFVQGALLLCLSPARFTTGRAAASGFLCGMAMLQDFIFGPAVILVAIAFIARLRGEGGASVARLLGVGIAGGAAPLALFAAYSIAIFGSPTIPYEYEYDDFMRESMQQGFMGIGAPSATVLWFTTVHPFRGLFFWTPVMLAAFAGAALLLRGKDSRLIGALALAAGVAYYVVTCGYYMWWGGWAMGARHLLPAFAILPIGLAFFCREESGFGWWTVVALGAAGVALSLPVSLIDPQTPAGAGAKALLALEIGDSPPLVNLAFVRAFYTLDFARGTEGDLNVLFLAKRLGAVVAPGVLVATAWMALGKARKEES